MSRSRLCALWVGLVLACGATQALAQAVCKPSLAVKEVRFSEMQLMQRTWSAFLDADASSCASSSGQFQIDFVRIKEYAPDLSFTEQFTWRPGRLEVSLMFWADEAVLHYSIGDIAPCTCREHAPTANASSYNKR
jgi:hypothetical protein